VKSIKRIAIIFAVIIIVIPILAYSAIVVTNNYLADRIEKNLTEHQMPFNTELIDSFSLAGKMTGNGNGMQYMGTILVKSDLSEQELKEYYEKDFDFIEVRKQETVNIDFIHLQKCTFNAVMEDGETYYSVTCWDSDRRDTLGDFVSALLDFDIRGH
jgi:hypothetical protein